MKQEQYSVNNKVNYFCVRKTKVIVMKKRAFNVYRILLEADMQADVWTLCMFLRKKYEFHLKSNSYARKCDWEKQIEMS